MGANRGPGIGTGRAAVDVVGDRFENWDWINRTTSNCLTERGGERVCSEPALARSLRDNGVVTASSDRRRSGWNTDGGIHEIPLPMTVRGRLWLCGKHAIGPDPDALIARVGADVVVCLNEEHELAERYPGYVAWLRVQPPDRVLWYPVPDLHAPGLTQFAPVLTDLVDRIVAGKRVIVHCAAGVGRAGTTAVAVLVSLAVPLDEALERVRRHRPMAGPEVGTQLDLVRALHDHLVAGDEH